MKKEKIDYYSVFKAKDTRFDGHFFVGISSTMIYCRPICRARLPKKENCSYYNNPAEAEQAGFRPCLLCRPELAPSMPISDNYSIANQMAKMLEKHCDNEKILEEISTQFGYSIRHLRRVFSNEFNVPPINYLQTCRLLLAKNLLTNSDLSILDVAINSGFSSLRRLNDTFKKHYNLTPSAIKKQAFCKSRGITIALGYRPPYRWDEMLEFLKGRSIEGVEFITEKYYSRTIDLIDRENNHIYGWIKVFNNSKNNTLIVTLSESLLKVLPQVVSKIKNMFDLYCEPHSIFESLKVINELRPNTCFLGTRIPGCFNPFEMIVRAILGQQITVKAANTLTSRLVKKYGMKIETEIENLKYIFPTPNDIVSLGNSIEEEFGSIGIIKTRSNTIYQISKAIVNKDLDFENVTSFQEMVNKLMTFKGIGSWSAQYIVMRTLGWADAFLETDAGIKNAFPEHTSRELLDLSKTWSPWRSYAIINIWTSIC